MIEALWSVQFQSCFGMHGSGVAVFETGRVFGGDSTMIYVGKFKVENGVIYSDINVQKYAHIQSMFSAVGLDHFNLKLTGTPMQNEMVLSGYVVEDPTRKITITAIRRAELP